MMERSTRQMQTDTKDQIADIDGQDEGLIGIDGVYFIPERK